MPREKNLFELYEGSITALHKWSVICFGNRRKTTPVAKGVIPISQEFSTLQSLKEQSEMTQLLFILR